MADQVTLLFCLVLPLLLASRVEGRLHIPLQSDMPQPAPWTCLCNLSPSHSEVQPHGLLVLSCPHAPAFLSPGPAHSLSSTSGYFSLLHSHPSLPLSNLSRGPTQRKTEACSIECKHLPEMMKAFCCRDIWFGGDSWES